MYRADRPQGQGVWPIGALWIGWDGRFAQHHLGEPCGIGSVATTLIPASHPGSAPLVHRRLVAWRDERTSGSNGDIYGARVATNGTVKDPSGFPIATGPSAQNAPALTRGPGNKWGVTYQGYTLALTAGCCRLPGGRHDQSRRDPGG